jgi:Xaa-Pro aminopeptidase
MTQATLKTAADKLAAMRAEMARQGVDGFIVPRADEYQGEYVPASAERLKWVSGFTGSAGAAVVLKDKAMVISDGRYTLQMAQQVDGQLFDYQNSAEGHSMAKWIAAHAQAGTKLGYDPRVMTAGEAESLRAQMKAKGIDMVPVAANIVDAVWADRPAAPMDAVEAFSEAVAGRTAADKRADVAKAVTEAGGAAMVLTMPDSIAWLLNIRGRDVPHVPTALSFAVVHGNGDVDWFIPAAKIPATLAPHLGNRVRVRAPEEMAAALADLAKAAQNDNKPVMIDAGITAEWFKNTLTGAGAKVAHMKDPCVLPRATKTDSERKAIIDAHVRDGVAMARFLKWVDDNAPSGTLTELSVEAELLKFRQRDKDVCDTSFDSIVGWNGNGAIVHYRATPATSTTIKGDGMLLVDSGGQYKSGGTTDITRTIAVGKPTPEMREHFTLVLKGHIAVATARFPEGTKGAAVDAMARKALWDRGLDYDHGTGHGVGCFLSVHEEACGISAREGGMPFKAGMLISNEPGFYKAGSHGIRIENLVFVKEDGVREGTTRKMLAFDTITLAPIDARLIEPSLLDGKEIKWMNDYHDRVYKTIAPLVEPDVAAWLKTACAPLKKNLKPASAPKPGI